MLATQLPLFSDEELRPRSARTAWTQRSRSVLHDPAVVEARARHDRLGCDLRSAFASFFAHLTPEQRAELRARLAA